MFCQFCGKQLQDGEVCTCTVNQEVEKEQPNQNKGVSELIKKVKEYVSLYIKSPFLATDHILTQNDMNFALLLTAVFSVCVGLSWWGLFNSAASGLLEKVKALMKEISYWNKSLDLESLIAIDFTTFMLWGIICALICTVLFVLMVFAVVRIADGTADLKKTYMGCAANSVGITVLFAVSFLMSFVSLTGAVVIFAIASLAWIVVGIIPATRLSCKSNEGKFWALYFIGVVLVVVIAWSVLPQVTWNAVGGIEVLQKGTVSEFIEEMLRRADVASFSEAMGRSLEGLIEELLYSLI